MEDLFNTDLSVCPQRVKNYERAALQYHDARFLLGKLCWLAAYSLCFLSRQLISVLYGLVILPVAPTGPLQVLTFEESSFIGEKITSRCKSQEMIWCWKS